MRPVAPEAERSVVPGNAGQAASTLSSAAVMSIDTIQRSGDTLSILVGESLTEDDVRVVCESLSAKPPTAAVIVDLRRMRMEEGSAMALLLGVLQRAGTRYSFAGLNSVHQRLQRYLASDLVARQKHARGTR